MGKKSTPVLLVSVRSRTAGKTTPVLLVEAGQVAVFNASGFAGNAVNQVFFCEAGRNDPAGWLAHVVTKVIADEAQVGDQPLSAVVGPRTRPDSAVNITIENRGSLTNQCRRAP